MLDTGLETNKGGRLIRAMQHLKGQLFHVTYGDGLGDIDLYTSLLSPRAWRSWRQSQPTNPFSMASYKLIMRPCDRI
jgi:hypothetical protein